MIAGIDVTRNENQTRFFNQVMLKVAKPEESPYKVFSYGGAIRGGKTFISLGILALLAKMFPGSRWHVIREDMPALQATAIPSMEKLLGNSPNWKWHRTSSDYYVKNKNGSRIYFKGENISGDPELLDFLGLETNGVLLEQTESLSEKLFNICLSRVGSWYLSPVTPPGLVLETFNPTQTWPKYKRYLPWRNGTLPPEYFFQPALPKDNPFVTNDQWSAWNMMDERYIRQFVDGDWTNFDDDDNRWAFAFDRRKHVISGDEWTKVFGSLWDPAEIVYLSWDFNRNPMVCTVIQWPDEELVKIPKVYKLRNMGVDGICERIQADFPGALFEVTGDYSGNTDSVLFENEMSAYRVIREKLNLAREQIQITPNPRMERNRILFNTALANYPFIIHETEAEPVIFDCENVKANADGTIDKGKPGERKTNPAVQADTLDTVRYWVNRYLRDRFYIPGG